MVSPALGQMMSGIGVSKGDSFTYHYTCYFNSNDSSVVMPAEFAWINQTDYYMMNVTSVSGSMVSYSTNMPMVNGTTLMGTGDMNMGNGVNSMSGYNPMGMTGMNSYFFMYSNVNMMGKMFPSSSNSPTINDTTVMLYPGEQRVTNHMSLVNNQGNVMNQTDYYFDQPTGAMVQWRQQYIQTNGNLMANSTTLMQLDSSSVWVVPEFPALLIAPLLFVGAALAVFIKIKSKSFNAKLWR